MTDSSSHLHRRALHGKRSFKHGSGLAVDSPLYDASEEDNDDTGDDGLASVVPSPQLSRNATASSPLGPNVNPRPIAANQGTTTGSGHPHRNTSHGRPNAISKVQGASIQPVDNEALYSPNDGDVESSTTTMGTAIATRPTQPHVHASQLSTSTFAEDDSPNPASPSNPWDSSTSTASSLGAVPSALTSAAVRTTPALTINVVTPSDVISTPALPTLEAASKKRPSIHTGHSDHVLAAGEPKPADISTDTIDPSALTPLAIRVYVQDALDGTGDVPRNYRPNAPPKDRPVRIYADGVYDIFHFGHALQLRQAKLSFPSVHLLVGVCSDELCIEHKSKTVMNHAERCESVRHCRWVDEIVSDAPWVIDQTFLDKHQIDFVAHDEDPYKGSDGSDDVYGFCKAIGRFIPTRRTPGVSTSELLERIVAGYLEGQWDPKLIKIGHPELASRAPSRTASRPESRLESPRPPISPPEVPFKHSGGGSEETQGI